MSRVIPADSMRVPYPFRGHPGVVAWEITIFRNGRDLVEDFRPIFAPVESDALSAWESEGGYSPPESDPSPLVASQGVTKAIPYHGGYWFIGGRR